MAIGRISGGLLGCVLAAACLPLGAAGIFKQELPDGTVIYSDQPQAGAEELRTPPPQVVEPFKPIESPRERGPESTRAEAYQTLTITRPAEDEVIWNNEGRLEVAIEIRPPLRAAAGHTLVLLIDAQPVARSAGDTRFVVQDVFRGTHVLEARVESEDGKPVLRSEPVTIHVRQHSILSPTRPRP